MRTSRARRRIGIPAVIAIGTIGAGCAGTPAASGLDVVVSLDEKMKSDAGVYPSLQVDLVGVNATDPLPALDVDEYFAPGSAWRRNADQHTFTFTHERPEPQRLDASDPIWRQWREGGATELLVLVDYLPDTISDQARRLRLPLDPEHWSDRTLRIVVLSNWVRCVTEPRGPAR